MNTLIDINIEDYKTISDKITVTAKNSNNRNFTEIKCFKNFEDVSYLEARKINLIKIQKTVFLNLLNLQEIDLRENKLHKISKKFLNFKNVKILRLDDNLISYFPSFLPSLEYLEHLTITNNQIKNIPTSIQNFQNLKIFKFSNNKIESIPIEIGSLKSMEILHMDANYLTQIPTSLCYLKHLSELSLEWLEFTDPPLQKVIKENIGKTIISLIRNSLQEMIKQNILYCDFHSFISRNSIQGASYDIVKNENAEVQSKIPHHSQTHSNNSIKKEPSENTIDLITTPVAQVKKLMKIFFAIDNNYYGVIKSLIYGNDDYLKIKNNDNKTPLYLTIHNNKFELTRLILSKIDFKNIINSYTYLHKSIRMRDAALTEKLIEMGIDVNETDDQGSSCFHILFSVFTKNFAKCSLIGDMLLRKGCKLNTLNHENWAPVHVASKRGAKECLQWIINQNKLLKKVGKENFDLNLKGKNKCTPLHISVICFRLEETFLLLEAGCDVFLKNTDGKSPRKVCYGNFLLSKLLRNYENYYLTKKFPSIEIIKETNHYITTVEEIIKIDQYNSVRSQNKIEEVASKNRWQDQYNSLDLKKQQLLHLNYNSSNYNTALEKLNDDELAESNIRKKLEKLRSSNSNINNYKSNQSKKEIPRIPRSQVSQYETEKITHQNLNTNNYPINLIPLPYSRKNSKKNNLRNSSTNLEKVKSKSVSKSNSKSIFETHPLKAPNKINLHFHKGIILGLDNSLAEKYESLMQLKLISNPHNIREVEKILELYLKEVDLDHKINFILLSDICDLIIAKHFSNLKSLLEDILVKTQNIKNNHFLNMQLKNTIQILKFVEQSEYEYYMNPKRYESNKTTKKHRKDSNSYSELKRKYKTKSNFITKPNSNQNKYFSENRMSNSKKKKSNGKNENEDSNDEYNFIEMNEISEVKNDIKSYENQMPIRILKELKSNVGLNSSQNNESCNVADSSFSILKPEKSVDEIKDENDDTESENAMNLKNLRVQRDKLKPSEKLYSSIPPKKVDSIFFDCDGEFEEKISEQIEMKALNNTENPEIKS